MLKRALLLATLALPCTAALADDQCLRFATDDEILRELQRRLAEGGDQTPRDEPATTFTTCIQNSDGYFRKLQLAITPARGSEASLVTIAPSEAECGRLRDFVSSRLPAFVGTRILAFCEQNSDGYFRKLHRVRIDAAGPISDLGFTVLASEQACKTQASTIMEQI
jgi:hypothetical protein